MTATANKDVVAIAAQLEATQSLGTGAEPSVDWDGKGLFVPAGSKLNSFTFAGSANNSEIQNLDLRIYFNYGPWNSAGETTHDLLYTNDGTALGGVTGMRRSVFTFDYTTPQDGYFAVVTRQNTASVLTATRYFYSAGPLDITLPPSV